MNTPIIHRAAQPRKKLVLLALVHPGSGFMPKGRGALAFSLMHCMNRPSLHSSVTIQSEVEVAPTIKITVITQHVKAITLSGRVTVMVSMVTCGAPIFTFSQSLYYLKQQ